jgi:hypothetical protein
MAARTMSDIDLGTIKNDIAALQHELDGFRRQSLNSVEQYVSGQPLQSMIIAFAAGFVVSRLLRHRLL